MQIQVQGLPLTFQVTSLLCASVSSFEKGVLWAELCLPPQNLYFEALTSQTLECDCIWRQGLYRRD